MRQGVQRRQPRLWGTVPRQNIIGKAVVVYWPFGVDNYGLLPNVTGVFAHVC